MHHREGHSENWAALASQLEVVETPYPLTLGGALDLLRKSGEFPYERVRNSKMQQRRFTKEFEEEAVRLVQTSGRTQREIAGDLGIGLSTLVRWIGRSRDRRAADPTTAAEGDVTAELKRLRRENEILRQERDILKKATAFFARAGSR